MHFRAIAFFFKRGKTKSDIHTSLSLIHRWCIHTLLDLILDKKCWLYFTMSLCNQFMNILQTFVLKRTCLWNFVRLLFYFNFFFLYFHGKIYYFFCFYEWIRGTSMDKGYLHEQFIIYYCFNHTCYNLKKKSVFLHGTVLDVSLQILNLPTCFGTLHNFISMWYKDHI